MDGRGRPRPERAVQGGDGVGLEARKTLTPPPPSLPLGGGGDLKADLHFQQTNV